MTEIRIPEKPQKTFKTRLGTLSKWLFFITAFFLLILTVLGNIGGNSDELKASIEQYIQSATGYHTTVKTLNAMEFFPDMVFDFEGTALRATPEDDLPVATIKRVHLITNFWSVMFHTGKVKALYIDQVVAQPGVLGAQAITIDRLHIDDTLPDPEQAALRLNGRVGEQPVSAEIGINKHSKNRWKTSYSLALDKGFNFSLGNITLSGTLYSNDNKVTLNDVRLLQNDTEVLTAQLYPANDALGNMRLTGEIVFPQHGSTLRPDLLLEKDSMKVNKNMLSLDGTLIGAPFKPQDFQKDARVHQFLTTLNDIFGTPTLANLIAVNRALGDFPQKECAGWTIHGQNTDQPGLPDLTPIENPVCE